MGGITIDKYSKVKRMLENYKMTKINIINMQKEIEFLEERDGIKAVSTEGVGGSANSISKVTETTALHNLDKRKQLERRIKKAQLKIDSIDRAVEGLNDIDKSIIKGFYIDDLMWRQVAYSVGYSEGHCKKRGASAIREMVKGIYGPVEE